MKKNRPSLDGFVPRRASTELSGGHHTIAKKTEKAESAPARRQQLHTGSGVDATGMATRPTVTSLGTSSIRQSLEAIDGDASSDVPVSRRERRHAKKARRKASKAHRIIKRSVIALIIVVVCIAGFIGIKAFINLNSVFQGGFFGLMQKQPLKQDANGRSNFLIFGTEEEGHPGANLTDSIMVLSVNQETKDAFMISIPRDLWVDYGSACTSGYRGKVNAVYTCASNDGEDQAAGTAALQRKIGSILGLDIQYYVHINFAALQEIVDAVGGVTVTVESNPKGMGILDRNFDWRCQYKCYYVKYKDGETVHLDGEHALALARARNAQGGYGLADSNFDREKNQQKIIRALREKALNVGTLTNLGKVTSLMDALGNNLKTNIDKKEIQTLMSLASDIKNEDIRSLALNDEKDPLVTTGNIEGQSSVFPVAGTYIYGDIQAFIKKNSVNNPVSREGAKVVVLNGTSVAGVAGKEAAVLTGAGYIVSDTDDAPAGTYAAIEVYKIGSGNTATTDALQKRYGVTVKTTSPPLSVSSDVSFVVVVGRAR